MEKIKVLGPETGGDLLEELFGIEFKMNSAFPQMVGPKVLSLGSNFLERCVSGKITYHEFQSFNPDDEMMNGYVRKVFKMHKQYGKSGNDINVDVFKLRELYLHSVLDFQKMLRPLVENSTHIYIFFENALNNQKIMEISKIFKAGDDVLHGDKWKKKSVLLKNSLRPVLESGLHKLEEVNLKELKQEWAEFSKEISRDVTIAMSDSRDPSSSLITDVQFSRFIEVISGSFKIEVNTRSDKK